MIIAVVGPTGVGKTRLSVALAHKYKAIIINCDAMQVYKGMDIGTAKIKEEEKEGIPHYLFSTQDVTTNYTVFDYQRDARKIIEENKDKNIIMVGGTGLYLKSALYNYVFDADTKNEDFDDLSNEDLYQLALQKDPNIDIHINNRKRLIRFLNKSKATNEECYPIYNAIYIGLTTNRDNLYERINARVEEMFNNGLVLEVKNFYDKKDYSKALNTAIGYKELFKYFDGDISLEETKEEIKKNSRHYAKRQYTWFNNQMNVKWFDVDFADFTKTIDDVIKYINKVK